MEISNAVTVEHAADCALTPHNPCRGTIRLGHECRRWVILVDFGMSPACPVKLTSEMPIVRLCRLKASVWTRFKPRATGRCAPATRSSVTGRCGACHRARIRVTRWHRRENAAPRPGHDSVLISTPAASLRGFSFDGNGWITASHVLIQVPVRPDPVRQ